MKATPPKWCLTHASLQCRSLWKRARSTKNTGFYKYSLIYTGEDTTDNVCLREKLRVEWGLQLPEFDTETGAPEQYFAELTTLFKASEPRWKIHRQLTLSLLSFGKMLMYYAFGQKTHAASHP